MSDIVTAAELAAQKLATALPRRWLHVQAVGTKAAWLGAVVEPADASLLVSAAWLHDIGYAPDIVDTGLHALDGARWLVRHGWDNRLAGLVANHSCALYEAAERGLDDVLAAEFPQEHSAVADALWYADMTTGPEGQDLSAWERLEEIRERYGPDDAVTRFWRRAEPELFEAVRRTEERQAAHPM
ncbi:HD domain-containing protein [Actinoplanes sp. NPDC051633]|uniref:HD domain-containing protein n=1 Tax=Actinoplanes sp. NPDC051633 TaxID=3155670 RepID=UPI0034432EA9